MEYADVKAITEALLFAGGEDGVTMRQITRVLDIEEDMISLILNELKFDYDNQQSGMMLVESRGSFFLATKPIHGRYVQKLLKTPHSSKLSQAALESLAIIAYLQPITRTEIDDIRGVNSDRSVQTLLSRMLIEEVGRKDGVGRPILFGTSKEFLTFFGLSTLEELPLLPEDVNVQDMPRGSDLFYESKEHETDESKQ